MESCGLAVKFRHIVLDLIWDQLCYLVYCGQNVEQLNERLVELTVKRISVRHLIDEATSMADQKIDEKVVHWMGRVEEISKQVEKLHQEGQGKRECSLTSCPNPWLRYKLSKRAKAMAQQVADICVEGYFGRVSYRVPPQWMPEITGESNAAIDSRVPIMNQIMEALQDPNVNMIGLCGLGGVGKTTIAKEVARASNQNWFEKVVMATVSDELNVEKIQGQIAEKLGMQLLERTEDVRASRLRYRLKKEKNMLLILDDLWEELDLRRVGIPVVDVEKNSKKNEGCKILLTSRNDALLSNCMKCQKIIKVGVLSENEALELFKRIVELSVDSSSSDLMSKATEIVRKCAGLPLAITIAAKTLRGKDLNEWKDYLARLNNPLRRNVVGIKELDTILKLSYDHLTSSEYKHVFMLAAMLSPDTSSEELLMYSVGLNILQHTENVEDARVGISHIVSTLKALNLFLDSFSSHHVTMHDVFRDFALTIASDEINAFIVRHRTVKELEVLYMGNSFNNWKDEGASEANENAGLEELKDLPISSLDIHIPNVSMLPEDLFLDMNLKRYRIFIGKCWKWQGNYGNSKTLKLELESSIHLKRGVQKLLEGVEELSLYGSNGIENVLYSHGHLQIESIDDIEYLSLNSTHHEAAATNNISNKNFQCLFKVLLLKLEILELSALNSSIPMIWDVQLSHNSFSHLKTLIVKDCGFVKLMPLHVLKSLNKLEELEVRHCKILEMVFDLEDLNGSNEMVSSIEVVPLKKLTLSQLPKLENVWSDDHQGIVSFQSLRSVHVSDCESLASMFPASIAKSMRRLKELCINKCGINAIVAKDQVSESVTAPFELASLSLSGLPNLRSFF